jgi:hypothetical protein
MCDGQNPKQFLSAGKKTRSQRSRKCAPTSLHRSFRSTLAALLPVANRATTSDLPRDGTGYPPPLASRRECARAGGGDTCVHARREKRREAILSSGLLKPRRAMALNETGSERRAPDARSCRGDRACAVPRGRNLAPRIHGAPGPPAWPKSERSSACGVDLLMSHVKELFYLITIFIAKLPRQ